MDLHERIRTLKRDKEFLEEERLSALELRDGIHKDASYPLWKEQDSRIKKIEEDLARKERDIQTLEGQLQLQMFPR